MNYLPKQIVWVALIASLLTGLAIGAAIRAGLNEKGSTEQSERVDIRSRSDWGVRNQEQAIRQVVEVVGVPEDLLPGITAQLVTVAEDNTPFLSQQIAGRPLWQVVINKWRLHLGGFEDRYERTFDVLVDPVNGNILKITSDWPDGIPEMAPEPEAWVAEERMGRSGLEKYHSFPDGKPSISFLEALNVLHREGIGRPLVAKQILGHYVVQSRMGREPKPVWAITLRGIEMPWHGGPPDAPARVLRRMRNLVHAETGEWLSASNQPALGSVHLQSPPRTATFEPPPTIPSLPPTVTLDLSSPSDGTTVAPAESIDWTITATVSVGDNFGLALVAVDLVQEPLNPELFDIPPGLPAAGMEDFDRENGISNPGPGGTGSAYGGTQIGTPGAMDLAQIGGAQNTFGVVGDGIGLDILVDTGVGQGAGGQVIATGEFEAPCTPGDYIFSLESPIANVLEAVNPAPSLVRSAEMIIDGGTLSFTVAGPAFCPTDVNGDGVTNVLDLIDLLLCFGQPAVPGCESEDVNEDGTVNVLDLIDLLLEFGVVCPCSTANPSQSLEEELRDAGLTMDDWDAFMDVMQNGTQEEKENWHCWMTHYLQGCPTATGQFCGGPACPDDDPFDKH